MTFPEPTSKEQLIEVLKQIDDFYRYRRGEYTEPELSVPELDYSAYVRPSDEQIAADAASLAALERAAETTARKNAYAAQKISLLRRRELAGAGLEEKFAEIDALYDASLEKLSADAAARNMSASSGFLEAERKLEESRGAAKLKARADAEEKQALVDAQIAEIDALIDGAEEELSEKYAAVAEKYRREFTADADKLADEALRYNNTVREKNVKNRNAVNQALGKMTLEYISIVYKGLTNEELDDLGYYADVITAIDGYYYTISAAAAYADFSSDPRMMYYLGDYYADMLYKYQLRKNDG